MKYHTSFIFSFAFIGLIIVPIFSLAQTTQPIQGTSPTPTATETIYFTSNLYFGLQNSDVLTLQQLLQRLGYFSTAIQPTGYFGPVTKSAVQSFQTAHGIPTTGYAGILTRTALAQVTVPGTPPPQLPPPQSKIPLSFSYHISDKLDKAGGPFTNQNSHPLLDSVIVNVKWALAEPVRGTYDWSLLDKKIAQWTGTSGKKVILKIAPYGADPADGEEGDSDDNDTTPSWVYDTGVP